MSSNQSSDDSQILTVQVRRNFVDAIDACVAKDTHINRSDWVRAALREKLEREMTRLGLDKYPLKSIASDAEE